MLKCFLCFTLMINTFTPSIMSALLLPKSIYSSVYISHNRSLSNNNLSTKTLFPDQFPLFTLPFVFTIIHGPMEAEQQREKKKLIP